MARTRRTVALLLAEVRRTLLETDPLNSGWTNDLLLDLMNQERDLIEMGLSDAHEGYNVQTYTTNLVVDQDRYQVPGGMVRVRRVLWVNDDGTEVPLQRNESYSRVSGYQTGGLPSYRVKGEYIVLDPAPGTARTDGLKMDIEEASDRLTAVGDTAIPVDWPLFCETLLVLSTAVAALDVEGAQGPQPEGYASSLVKRREVFLGKLVDYVEQRSYGLDFREGFSLGGD